MKIEFVADDVIRNKKTGKIAIVTDNNYAGINMIKYHFPNTPKHSHIGYQERFEHWKPKQGEYCWFWNHRQLDNCGSPEFGKYGVYSYTEQFYDFIEPFFGNIPTHMES